MIVRLGMSRGHRASQPWYVDAVNGNDANQGKSSGAALRTIAAVLPKIKAGDTVALAAGSHWRESFTVPADGVHIVSYGTGAKPLLDCSDVIVPWETWKPALAVPAAFTGWTGYRLSGITAAGTAPDGSTAYKLGESTDNPSPHFAQAAVSMDAGAHQFSVFLKAGERTWGWVGYYDGSWHKACVNLLSGALGTVDAGVAATIASLDNGWFRVDASWSAAGTQVGVGITSADGGGSLNDSGGGTAGNGIYVWYPANAVWSKTASATTVYQANVPIDWATGQTFVSVWENNTRLVRAASVAACDTTAGSYFPSAENTSPITLYVHASDGSNPATNGKTYEYSRRQHALDVNGHAACVFRGVWTRRNLHTTGSLIAAAQNYDCLASEGSYHNIYIGPGSYLENVEALDAYWPQGGFGVLAIYNANTPNGDNVTFRNCWFHCTAYNPLINAVDGHANTSGKFGTVLFDTCRFDNCYYGVSGSNTAATVISGGSATNCHRAIAPSSDTLTVTNFGATAIYRGIDVQAGTVSATITNFNCLVTGGWASFGIYVGCPNFNLTLEQSSIFGGGVFAVYCTFPGFTFHAHHNTIAADGYAWNITSASPVLDSDYNTFQASPVRMDVAGTDYTLAAYKTATGQDQHSTP